MSAYDTATAPPQHELRRRQPTGAVGWPLIVLEGPDTADKTLEAARFTADARLGEAFWIEYGGGDEGVADEYIGVDHARYTILEHDGTYPSVYGQIVAAKNEARRVHEAGEPPCCLIVDSWSAMWDDIRTWTYLRAKAGLVNSTAPDVEIDPNAELNPGRNLWTDARERYRAIMTQLLTFPGVVVLTVRGEWVSVKGEDGQPARWGEYVLEAHRTLKHDARLRVRLEPGKNPLIVKARSAKAGYDTHLKPYELREGLDLGEIVFERMGVDPGRAPLPVSRAGRYAPLPERIAAGRLQQSRRGRTDETVIGRGTGPVGRQEPEPAASDMPLRTLISDQDWLDLLERKRGDHAALVNLYRAAQTSKVNSALLHRIAVAGQEARDAAEARAAREAERAKQDGAVDEGGQDADPAPTDSDGVDAEPADAEQVDEPESAPTPTGFEAEADADSDVPGSGDPGSGDTADGGER
ncbi:hypothetical protein [Saccharothrix sp. HUAS TT1]|uniref:hypothetical protein n=1 Tax=unclassified Saccharothrix TaxID=2593673 RepID=UPI00345BA292